MITYETNDFIWSKQKTLIRKFYFCVCVYIYMIDITKEETLGNNNIEVIVDGVNTLWLNEKHIEE